MPLTPAQQHTQVLNMKAQLNPPKIPLVKTPPQKLLPASTKTNPLDVMATNPTCTSCSSSDNSTYLIFGSLLIGGYFIFKN